jgi:hypothetical protein
VNPPKAYTLKQVEKFLKNEGWKLQLMLYVQSMYKTSWLWDWSNPNSEHAAPTPKNKKPAAPSWNPETPSPHPASRIPKPAT